MSIIKEWYDAEQSAFDEDFQHRETNEEYRFYIAVIKGDVDYVRQNCLDHRFTDPDGVGKLSRDPVTNLKYHFVVCTAMIARLCAEQGMEQEKAFRLSDFYIRKLDDLHTTTDVENVHDKMVMDYARRMKVLRQNAALSRPINKCLNYIYAHMTDRITIEDLAEHTHNSTSYISRLFKEELGTSASDYIRKVKVDAAKNMLRFSEYTLIDIANYLAFSSQSHFIQLFQKEVGMTPKKYRELYQSTYWKGSDYFESILEE